MHRNTLQTLAVSSLTVGGALTILGGFPDRFDRYVALPESLHDIVLFLGIALIFAAGLLFVAARLPRRQTVTYGISGVDPARLRDVYDFIVTVLDDVAAFEVFRSWYEKNPDVIQAVVRTSSGRYRSRQELVGFFSVFPVTERARSLLQSNVLLGAGFTEDHICRPGHIPAAYYIGAVGSVGRRGRQATLFHLVGYVAALLRRHGKLVFTRPMTKDGLRLARDYRFAPVRADASDPKNTIFVRDFARDPAVF